MKERSASTSCSVTRGNLAFDACSALKELEEAGILERSTVEAARRAR